jgi:phosphoserine aminotransferase
MSFKSIPQEMRPSHNKFGSGPSYVPQENIHAAYLEAKNLLGMSHRKNEVIELVKNVSHGFRTYFNLPKDYSVVFGNGGATFLWDMMGLGLVKNKSRHYTSGEFSQKWFAAHAKIPWIKCEEKSIPYGENHYLSKESTDADTLCITLNETSTGVQLFDLPNTTADQLLLMDATSGAGQIPVQMDKIDCYYFSPQKVFAGEGGLFIGFVSPKCKERISLISKNKERYIPEIMNWENCLSFSEKFQTYNTPSTMNFILLKKQLEIMNSLGAEKVYALAAQKAQSIYQWAESKEYLSPYVSNKDFRSQTVATINLDDRYSASTICQFFRNEKIAFDIDSYRKLGKNQFRISLFHNIELTDIKKLCDCISYCIEQN